jgi:hypothetical protein
VQALLLMGWYWEGPEGKHQYLALFVDAWPSDIALDVTKNVFYWTRVAGIVAQGSGMHRRYTHCIRFVPFNADHLTVSRTLN